MAEKKIDPSVVSVTPVKTDALAAARAARKLVSPADLESKIAAQKRTVARYERRLRIATHRFEGAKIRLESLMLRNGAGGRFDPLT